ncbi:MAG: DUF4147 domain-containing protein [Myxococcota bacterium]|jgi:hydroxypyruvate reductase|nr:DUF4147 domain-containing protein [Myxococcota bacterium]
MTSWPSAPDPRSALRVISEAALDAVDARKATRRALVRAGYREASAASTRLVVVAIGKAAAGMASAVVEEPWPVPLEGIVVTKDDHAAGFDLGPLEVVEAAHPVPDDRSAAAGRRVLEVASNSGPEDLLLVLLSGGASSLVSLPPDEITIGDLAQVNSALLGSGASIHELNAVRKHLSRISGGRLARASGARRVVVLAISDVMGDDLAVIGSGPCAPDPTTYGDALGILRERVAANEVPDAVWRYLDQGTKGAHEETPKPGDGVFEHVDHEIIARNQHARTAAVEAAVAQGALAIDLGERLDAEASDTGRNFAALVRAARTHRPTCLIAGGETVVTLRGSGRGGRSQELALAAALALEGSDATLLALGTDGTDGPTDAAGAWADGSTAARARETGFEPMEMLAANDAYPLFDPLGELHRTGPTGTNVMDLVLVWIPPTP